MQDDKSTQDLVSLVLKVVGLAMGVVVIVLTVLGVAEAETVSLLLAIGLFGLGLAALQSEE